MSPILERILKIKPDSHQLSLLLIPPIYCLWLVAIGRKIISKESSLKGVYLFLSSLTTIMFTTTCVLPFWLLFSGIDLNSFKHKLEPILAITMFSWISTILILSFITVNKDRELNQNKHYGSTDGIEYVNRFIAFFAWPYNTRKLQLLIHEKYLD